MASTSPTPAAARHDPVSASAPAMAPMAAAASAGSTGSAVSRKTGTKSATISG
ncbi:hypothetical protein [Rhodovulum viride]|uniref:hypothetical protein n=1 Tax=Rhodovulum viride TaxID=1231134 RepID=UPI0015ECC209|nr:hypothetical protein [Rhodovulum viride]